MFLPGEAYGRGAWSHGLGYSLWGQVRNTFPPTKGKAMKKSKRPDLMELNTLLRRKLKCSIPDSDKHLQKENKTRNGQWTSDDQDQENVRDKIRQLEVAKMVNGISAKSCTHTL